MRSSLSHALAVARRILMGSGGDAALPWLFPDVASLPQAERRRAIAWAFAYARRDPTIMMPLGRMLVWATLVGVYAAAPFLPALPGARVRSLDVVIIILALLVVFAALNIRFLVADMRALLRIHCNRIGIHTCAACGYLLNDPDLQRPDGVCTECGCKTGAANEKQLITLMPQGRVFPELRLFKDPDAAESALRRAFGAHPVIHRRRRGVAVAVGMSATLVVGLGISLLTTDERSLHLPRSIVVPSAAAAGFLAMMGWRRYCIRTIRGELIREQPK